MTSTDERRWREALEKLDVDTVRHKLADGHTGPGIGAEVRGIVDQPMHPSRGFVETWLAEKAERKAARSAAVAYWTLLFAAIGAVASVISLFWPHGRP